MTTDDEQEIWTDLLASKGWARLVQWAQTEWTQQKERAIAMAANETADVLAMSTLRQVLAADRAVQLVLNHPRERLKGLQHQPTERMFSRGGV